MSAALKDAGFSKPPEQIVPFPLYGQVGTIRRCARDLENIHGDVALHYWKRECRALAENLRRLGCDEEEISVQVLTFQTEVQVEMMRRYSQRLADEAQNDIHA